MGQRFVGPLITGLVFFIYAVAAAGQQQQKAPALPEVWTAPQAVFFALANSPDSRMGRERIQAANAAIALQKAALYPTVSVTSGYSQTDNPMYSFGNILNQGAFSQSIDFNDPGRTDDLNAGVQFNYRLYNGGRDREGVRAAEAQGQAAELELLVVHERLALEVVRAYSLMIQAEEIVKTRAAMVEAFTASLAVGRARFDEGVLLQADLLDLEVQHGEARENLIQARHGLDLTRQIFLNLLGLDHGPVNIAKCSDCDQEVPKGNSQDLRPELRSLDAMLTAARARLRQVGGGYLPVVDGFAGYGLNNGLITGGSGDSWQAGVKLQYNLFNGQQTDAEVAGAAARLAELEEQRRKMELGIGLEIKQAELSLHEADERLAVIEQTVSQALESSRINRERFKEGLILSADLIAVENRSTAAEIRLSLAHCQRRIAVAELRRAMGQPQYTGQTTKCME